MRMQMQRRPPASESAEYQPLVLLYIPLCEAARPAKESLRVCTFSRVSGRSDGVEWSRGNRFEFGADAGEQTSLSRVLAVFHSAYCVV
mgnify:CR=1 FL=1|jgi:hypothetical protein